MFITFHFPTSSYHQHSSLCPYLQLHISPYPFLYFTYPLPLNPFPLTTYLILHHSFPIHLSHVLPRACDSCTRSLIIHPKPSHKLHLTMHENSQPFHNLLSSPIHIHTTTKLAHILIFLNPLYPFSLTNLHHPYH